MEELFGDLMHGDRQLQDASGGPLGLLVFALCPGRFGHGGSF